VEHGLREETGARKAGQNALLKQLFEDVLLLQHIAGRILTDAFFK